MNREGLSKEVILRPRGGMRRELGCPTLSSEKACEKVVKIMECQGN